MKENRERKKDEGEKRAVMFSYSIIINYIKITMGENKERGERRRRDREEKEREK